jgi:uncharacterized protein YjdB
MKRISHISLGLLVILFTCYSCKKDENKNSSLNLAPSGIKQVTRTSYSNYSQNEIIVYKFGYESGRVSQITSITSFFRDSILLFYNSDNQLAHIRWNTEDFTINYSYNDAGLISTASNKDGLLWQTWIYNSDHKLIKISFTGSSDELTMAWNSDGDVVSADLFGAHYSVLYDEKRNPFSGFPEQPFFLTSIINIGAYFISPPTSNNITKTTVTSDIGPTMTLELKYMYNKDLLPVWLQEINTHGPERDSVVYNFIY